jgi:hypothetical protein
MKNRAEKRARYMRDSVPRRLGALAADLARVSASAHHPNGAESVALMLEESRYFIEWVAAETEPEIGAELVDMQVMLGLWRRAWPEASRSESQRALLSFQAKKWSDQVLDYSGLLAAA